MMAVAGRRPGASRVVSCVRSADLSSIERMWGRWAHGRGRAVDVLRRDGGAGGVRIRRHGGLIDDVYCGDRVGRFREQCRRSHVACLRVVNRSVVNRSVVAALSSAGSTSTVPSSGGPSAGLSTAQQEQYCVGKGGEPQTREAYWGTNGDENSWVPLAGSTTMCRFQADDEAKSRIYVDLTTLSSPSRPWQPLPTCRRCRCRPPPVVPTRRPATAARNWAGPPPSAASAPRVAGGSPSDPDDVVVALCVFPDLSFIDEWGLAYHSDGTVRGTDLATVMAYQPSGPLPPVSHWVGRAAPPDAE